MTIIKFYPRLCQNYISILESGEYCDVAIQVGTYPIIQTFHAHKVILCYRSPAIQNTLASNASVNNFAITNISPEIFQIILKYIYGGIITLNEQNVLQILKVLAAADLLYLQELVNYLQNYFIENKSKWIEQHFEIAYQISINSNSLLELRQFCTDCMAKTPLKIFESLDFTSIPEESLISLIKRDDLQMKEVQVWECVLKWGLKKNQPLTLDPKTWSDNDFQMMKYTLQHCLPLIRFYSLSSKEFVENIHPYKQLLNYQLYEDLFKSYLDPNSEPSGDILLPRYLNADGIIDSKIVNLNIVSIISKWIDKTVIHVKFDYLRKLYLPYEFKLLLRGSRDGFTSNQFHKLCDNIPNTITFIKLKETEEIIGGYNPIIWKKAKGHGIVDNNFIFSFKNKNDFKDFILSNIKVPNKALFYHPESGPSFGNDLLICQKENSSEYNFNGCVKDSYEKCIRDTGEIVNFSIEEYEVFQIRRRLGVNDMDVDI